MKKVIVVMFAVLFVVVGAVSMATAGPNVGNTNQKGSLLIFPKIDVSGEGTTDTYITIANDENFDVDVKCYWEVGEEQETQDFQFTVTKNQPIWFSAFNGTNAAPNEPVVITVPPFPGDETGALVCFAVDPTGAAQIRWNHLSGTATVMDFAEGTAYSYNSWNYAVRTADLQGAPVGTPGKIRLDGVTYDANPAYLTFTFPAVGALDGMFQNVDLTLMSGKQDVRTQEQLFTPTKAKFEIWNENEVKFTGVYQCMGCWFDDDLSEIQRWPATFLVQNLQSAFGRFRVQGVAATTAICPTDTCPMVESTPSPLIGLEVLEIDMDLDGVEDATTALTPAMAGQNNTGYVFWDLQGATYEIARH